MDPRSLALCVLLSSTAIACLNTSQPRSRISVSDQVVAPAGTPRSELVRVVARPVAAADRAEVEVLPVPGQSLGRIRATVMVRAAADRVRAVLFDFANYPAFLPNYKSAKLEGTTSAGHKLVFMEIDALGGMIRRWMRIDFSPGTVDGTSESFSAHLVAGDVKAFEAHWLLQRLEDGTRLTLESFLDANVQLPSTFIDTGSAAGLKESILNIKARAEEGGL